MLDQNETEVTLAALRNRRAEIERWLDGPAKKATLSALGRVIAELELQNEANSHREAAATTQVTGDVAERRPVTPEVAGSSPVAPVKVLQISICI